MGANMWSRGITAFVALYHHGLPRFGRSSTGKRLVKFREPQLHSLRRQASYIWFSDRGEQIFFDFCG
jgi:hypothetical protein